MRNYHVWYNPPLEEKFSANRLTGCEKFHVSSFAYLTNGQIDIYGTPGSCPFGGIQLLTCDTCDTCDVRVKCVRERLCVNCEVCACVREV